MTLKECIDIVDNIKPNQYTVKDKVLWLSFIDEIIINDVLKTHEGYDGRYDDFSGYSEDKLSVALIVPSPYDRLYTAYLKMKIDGENGETARYNNSAVLFNSYMLEYRKYYNKTHMPLNATEKRTNIELTKKYTVGLTDAEYESLKRDLEYALTEFFSNSVSPDKLYNAVYNYAQNNLEMLKGKNGETPIKGRDYFTEDEVNDIKADAKNQTIADLSPELSALDNKINKNSSDIKQINSQVLNHDLFINAEMPEYLGELRNLVNNVPKLEETVRSHGMFIDIEFPVYLEDVAKLNEKIEGFPEIGKVFYDAINDKEFIKSSIAYVEGNTSQKTYVAVYENRTEDGTATFSNAPCKSGLLFHYQTMSNVIIQTLYGSNGRVYQRVFFADMGTFGAWSDTWKTVETLEEDLSALADEVGNISTALDELHTYAQALIGGEE